MTETAKVLIGVGGSGQHVVHAYLRMLAVANCSPSDVPHVYVIDADASVATSGAADSALCANIARLHRQLVRPLARENRAHFALLRPYFQTNPESAPGKAADNLELNRCPAYLKDIFLTDEAAESLGDVGDRGVDLLQGMMANAKIGATSFGFKLMRCADNPAWLEVNFGYRDKEEGTTYSLLKDVQRANVAIVGSSFGGTGSGVIPALVRYLAGINVRGPRSVRAFMTLPWFELEGDGVSAASARGNSDPKARNSALGLRTYLGELQAGLPRSNYVVAQFPGAPAKRLDKGNFGQGEDPHVFNLILASSIQHFLWSVRDNGGVEGDPNNRKLLGLITSREEEQVGRFDTAVSAHLRYKVSRDDNRSLLDLVLEAELTALALEKGAEYIRPGKNQFLVRGADKRDEPQALKALAKTVAVSYAHMALVKKGLPMMKREAAPDEVYGALADALADAAHLIRESLLWVDRHKVTEDAAQGLIFPRLMHLFNIDSNGQIVPASEEDLVARWKPYGALVTSKQTKGQALNDSTPRISQAFTLFLNCFFSEVHLIQELQSLAENQPEAPIYSVVANLVSGLVHREVISARQASRNTSRKADTQDEAPPESQVTAFFRNAKLDIEVQDSRLCAIAKESLDAELGEKGSSFYQSPTEDSHPLSVRHLDPYVGVSSSQRTDLSLVSDKLARGEGSFPELPLKGIPNVIAPLLIQEWRLSRSEGGVSDPLAPSTGARDLRLSDAGLFQHAARIVEAGFWLLFTKHHKTELIELEPGEAAHQAGFVQLVERELKAFRDRTGRPAGTGSLPRYVIAFRRSERSAPIRPILVQDERCGWYLASNGEARKFLATLLPELPSVRYGKAALDAAWRGQDARGLPRIEPGSFDYNMANAFCRYVTDLVRRAGGESQQIGWLKALAFVRKVLGQAGMAGDTETVLVGTGELPFAGASGEGLRFTLRVPQPLLPLSVDLFIRQPVFFFNGDETKDYGWSGIWPLCGAAWEFMDPPQSSACPMTLRKEKDSDLGTGERSAWHVLEIRLPLKSLGVKHVAKPFDGEGGKTVIPGSSERNEVLPWVAPVWPNFEAPDWTYYLAGGFWDGHKRRLDDFDLEANSFEVTDIEWRFFGEAFEGGAFGPIGTVVKNVPVKLSGVPRAVEIVMSGRVMGSMPVQLARLPEAAQPTACDVAIDFGTSNTCMAIKLDGAKEAMHLPVLPGEPMLDGKPLDQFTLALSPTKGSAAAAKAADELWRGPRLPFFFFQSFSTEIPGRSGLSVPSELINMRTLVVEGQAAFLEANQAAHAAQFALAGDLLGAPAHMRQAVVTPFFTPIPPLPGGMRIEQLSEFLKGGLERDFKWPSVLSGQEASREAFRAVYLEQMFAAASATLRRMGIRDVKRIVATYPGAFEPGHRARYVEHLNLVVNAVFARAGIRLTQSKQVIPKSETVAALTSAKPNSASVCVTVDMGGGTTDVGIVVPDMEGPGQPFSYMSSVRYAGNDLLRALLTVPKLRVSLGSVDESDERRLDSLRIKIRAGDQKLSDPAVGSVAQAFFDGLFEYVFSLLAAVSRHPGFPHESEIRFHLFGNGFKLTNVFLERNASDFLTSVKRELTEKGVISPEVSRRIHIKPVPGDAKLALIEGAITGAIDETDSDDNNLAKMLRAVEAAGHSRVAIWYPCVKRKGEAVSEITLGTAAERAEVLENLHGQRDRLTIDFRNMEALQRSFPLTSKYWAGNPDVVDRIFGAMPNLRMIALGAYYLSGSNDGTNSFASEILPVIGRAAKKPSGGYPDV